MENRQVTDDILAEVGKIIIGKNMVIRKVLMAMLAGGNILLDDRPGVGKTTLAMAMAKVTGLEFKRVQFTPDVQQNISTRQRITGSCTRSGGSGMAAVGKRRSRREKQALSGTASARGRALRRVKSPDLQICTKNTGSL